MRATAQIPVPFIDDYVPAGVAARFLHVSPKTVNRWSNEGKIPYILTLGGHRRFRRADIDAAVEQMATSRLPSPR